MLSNKKIPAPPQMKASKNSKKWKDQFQLQIHSPDGSQKNIILQQSQILIGRAPHADLKLEHESISFYHALLLVESETLVVIDVNSENGVVVNNKRIHRRVLNHGDILGLGGHVIHVELLEEQDSKDTPPPKFADLNHSTQVLQDAPPPLPVLRAQKNQGHLALIDGEWCDIKFRDEDYNPTNKLAIEVDKDRFQHYIDTEEKEIHQLLPESQRFLSAPQLELVFSSHGNIIFFESYPLNPKIIQKIEKYLPKELKNWGIPWKEMLQWDDSAQKLKLSMPRDWASEEFEKWTKKNHVQNVPCDNENNEWVFNKNVNQVFVRYRSRVNKMGALRFWHGRQDFLRVLRNTTLLFTPFLLLLLVEIPVMEEPPVEEVIIYKPELIKEKAEEKIVKPSASAGDAPNPEENSLAAANQDKPKADAEAKKSEQKTQETPAEPVKVKINLASQFKGLLGDKVDLSNKEVESSSGKKSNAAGSLNGSLGVTKGKLETSGGGSIKGMAASGELSGKGGFRGKGQGKSDFDSAFTATKTVVLGSIDPELLRKILREYIPQFRYCYQNELSNNPRLGGILDLNFSLNGEGKVTSSKVIPKTGTFSPKGIGCIDGVLKSIPFPKPKGGGRVDVKQPLNFTSEKNKIN